MIKKRSKMIKLNENGDIKNWISDIKINQDHIKLSFSMICVYIDFYTLLIEMRKFENQFMILIISENERE